MMNERDLEHSEKRVERERLRSVERSREAVKAQGADECVDCGEPISQERRLAAPFADRCISCQKACEKQRKLYA